MGYFSNGDEGYYYEEKYCSNCVHQGDLEVGPMCPVWGLHLSWSYEQDVNNKDTEGATPAGVKRIALSTFIPQQKDGIFNDECRMFHRKPEGEQLSMAEMLDGLEGNE